MDDVILASVVGVDDPKWGEVGLAALQTRPGSELDEQQVTDYLKERLAAYKVPKHIRFVDEIPMNAQGKVQKNELKRLYAPGH